MADRDEPITLTNCDREPIHLLGAIQPIGFLVAISADWIVERASANLVDFLGIEAKAAIGRPISDLFSVEAVHLLRNRLSLLLGADAVERVFACRLRADLARFDVALHLLRNRLSLLLGEDSVERVFACTLRADLARFDVALHLSGGQVVIEGEPTAGEPGDATNTVRSMMTRVDRAEGFAAFFTEGARLVRALTGFDRVMVYRFDESGSGEVVAEACRAGIGSFKGLHYPAADIPAQARVLYKRNTLRVIADIAATPVPIVPAFDAKGRPLDLSLSILRSVSPIHIEYLKNMGVGASMSISIVVDDKLWGLFACHHYAPLCPSYERRSTCELFAHLFSMRIESRERKETVEFERRARDISDQLLGAVASDETLLNDPDWLGDILTQAIPADGVGVWINGSSAFSGSTPAPGDFRRLVATLGEVGGGRVFTTDHISSLLPGAQSWAGDAAGMLAIPISRAARDYVVLFRQELIRSVRWGGDPYKPVEYGPNGPRLTPRESFAEWKELVHGRAKAFTPSELRVAETLRATLIEVVLRMADAASSQRQQANERQELLIAELNHRVRNILGVIRGLIRQSKPHDDTVESFVELVDGRIHALARAHNQITDDHWGPAPIQALIDAEAAAFLADDPDRIRTAGGYVLLNPQAYSTMALVIHELVTNSAKYGSLSDGGRVEIDWRRNTEGDLEITWREIDGPPVTPPSRKGFGSTIVDRSVPYDLGGRASIDYHRDGVVAKFCIPARHVSEAGADRVPAIRIQRPAIGHPVAPPQRILGGHEVLLVEDSLIIALDAEDHLSRLGADTVATAASVGAALASIDAKPPTLAVLDINLGDGTSYPVADRLAELGVPFLFASGYGEQAQLPPEHDQRRVVQKPYTIENLARAMAELIAPEAS